MYILCKLCTLHTIGMYYTVSELNTMRRYQIISSDSSSGVTTNTGGSSGGGSSDACPVCTDHYDYSLLQSPSNVTTNTGGDGMTSRSIDNIARSMIDTVLSSSKNTVLRPLLLIAVVVGWSIMSKVFTTVVGSLGFNAVLAGIIKCVEEMDLSAPSVMSLPPSMMKDLWEKLSQGSISLPGLVHSIQNIGLWPMISSLNNWVKNIPDILGKFGQIFSQTYTDYQIKHSISSGISGISGISSPATGGSIWLRLFSSRWFWQQVSTGIYTLCMY